MLRKNVYIALALVTMLSLLPVGALAATVQFAYSGGNLTVTYPDSYTSCKPSDMISVSGVAAGFPVTLFFQYLDATTNSVINLGSQLVTADGSWSFPYPDVGGTMTFAVALRDNTTGKVLKAFKWTITCEPSTGADGCTPGYWKNHLSSWAPTGFDPSDIFDTVFGTSYFSSTYTLDDAINQGGGGVNRLVRHGTAALLSAAHPDVDYPYSVAQVIEWVQDGIADPLAQANELGCPIN
jgi:hypothetical protein